MQIKANKHKFFYEMLDLFIKYNIFIAVGKTETHKIKQIYSSQSLMFIWILLMLQKLVYSLNVLVTSTLFKWCLTIFQGTENCQCNLYRKCTGSYQNNENLFTKMTCKNNNFQKNLFEDIEHAGLFWDMLKWMAYENLSISCNVMMSKKPTNNWVMWSQFWMFVCDLARDWQRNIKATLSKLDSRKIFVLSKYLGQF